MVEQFADITIRWTTCFTLTQNGAYKLKAKVMKGAVATSIASNFWNKSILKTG